MARKKSTIKRMRDRISTQEFFAVPPDDDADDDPPCTCVNSTNPQWHTHAKPDDWVKTTHVPQATIASWKTHLNKAWVDSAKITEEEESSTPLAESFDWREKAAELVDVSFLIAQDTSISTALKAEATCSYVLGKALCFQEELDALLCCVETVNVEKTYEVPREKEYGRIRREQVARHGGISNQHASDMFRDCLVATEREKLTESGERKGWDDGDELVRRKRMAVGQALVEFVQNLRAAVMEVREICRDVDDRPIRLSPEPPEGFTFHSRVVPSELPRCVRSGICDLEFIHHEVLHLKGAIPKLADQVRQLLVIWSCACK